jgi:hypothetical protein
MDNDWSRTSSRMLAARMDNDWSRTSSRMLAARMDHDLLQVGV